MLTHTAASGGMIQLSSFRAARGVIRGRGGWLDNEAERDERATSRCSAICAHSPVDPHRADQHVLAVCKWPTARPTILNLFLRDLRVFSLVSDRSLFSDVGEMVGICLAVRSLSNRRSVAGSCDIAADSAARAVPKKEKKRKKFTAVLRVTFPLACTEEGVGRSDMLSKFQFPEEGLYRVMLRDLYQKRTGAPSSCKYLLCSRWPTRPCFSRGLG